MVGKTQLWNCGLIEISAKSAPTPFSVRLMTLPIVTRTRLLVDGGVPGAIVTSVTGWPTLSTQCPAVPIA